MEKNYDEQKDSLYICTMKTLMTRIDSLILEHDCVIIPDFGGFVINRESACVGDNNTIIPPRLTVCFNPDLRHNDGLLAELYMQTSNISYDVACKLIADAVREIITTLSAKQTILVGKLGILSLDNDGHLIFAPRSIFYHPLVFGYSPINIKQLSELVEINKKNNAIAEKRTLKRIFGGVAAVAAAILIFFISSTPITQNPKQLVQKAGFLSEIINTSPSSPASAKIDEIPKASTPKSTIAGTDDSDVLATTNSTQGKVDTTPNIQHKTPKTVKSKPFHIIVGGGSSHFLAEELLKKLHLQGFSGAQLLSSPSRYRIAIASFENKNDANKYLANLKQKNARYSDAWLFVKP